MEILIPIGIGVGLVVALIIFLACIYKVADVDKALIITGGKEPVIKVSGGAFVIPVFRKASYFDLCMLTVTADADEIKTSTAVPVVCDWTAQIRPCVSDPVKLRTAIISFKERGNQGIIDDVKLTLMGAVRDVVAAMTPEQILREKEEYKKLIQTAVSDELDNMGLELVSLNIQDITDNNDYFNNIAAIDAADKQQAADIKRAEVDKITRQKQAVAKKEAEIAEAQAKQDAEIARMTAEQTEKEKRKETDMKLAQFKIETDTANADAEIAKELQMTIRQKEVEERKGAVEITRQEQANLAAQKEREVMITRAEAEKETKRVNAEAEASVKSIEAEAKIKVAEREADAARKAAQGEADVETTKAEARVKVASNDAEAVKRLQKQRHTRRVQKVKLRLLLLRQRLSLKQKVSRRRNLQKLKVSKLKSLQRQKVLRLPCMLRLKVKENLQKQELLTTRLTSRLKDSRSRPRLKSRLRPLRLKLWPTLVRTLSLSISAVETSPALAELVVLVTSLLILLHSSLCL